MMLPLPKEAERVVAAIMAAFPGTEIEEVRLIQETCGWCGGIDPPHSDCEENKDLWARAMRKS